MGKKPYSRVYLEVTNVCNKDCSFCIGTKRAPRNMTLAEVDLITDKLLPFTDYIYFHLMGEPLLHKDIFDMISLATKKGFKCAITTNGSLLEKHGNALIDSGAYKVNISLHSFEGASEEAHIFPPASTLLRRRRTRVSFAYSGFGTENLKGKTTYAPCPCSVKDCPTNG